MGNPVLLAIIRKAGGDLYYGNGMYCTWTTDTPANTLFHERIRDCDYERAVTFPWWSRSGGAVQIRFLDLINTDAEFDSLILDDDWRDTVVDLYLVQPRAAFSTAVQVGSLLVEKVTTPDTDTFRLNAYSVFEALDKTLTTTYPVTISNTQYRNTTKPISLGRVRWQYPINHTLNVPSSSTRGVYDVADGYFEDILQLLSRGLNVPESQTALVTNSPKEYFIVQDTTGYGFKLRQEDYRLSAEVRGQLRRDSNVAWNSIFTFSNGSGGALYWTGGTRHGQGSLQISGDGSADFYTSQTVTVVAGAVYQIEVDITTITGVAVIAVNGTILRSIDTTTGKILVTFTAVGTTDTIQFGFPTGATGDAYISNFKCYLSHRIDKLSEIMRFVVSRSTLTDAVLDIAHAEDVEDLYAFALNFATTNEISGGELLRKAAESYGASFYQNSSGLLTPIRLEPPNVTEDFEIFEVDIDGTIQYEPDFAPGLSTRMKYGQNYNIHSVDDVSGLAPTSTTNIELREDLMRDHGTVTTTETLHSLYADAEEREPLDSLLTDESEAQTLIDYICGDLYSVARGFYSLRAFVTTVEPYTIEPGQTVKVYNSRYGMSAGVNLLVVYAKSSFGEKAIDLVLWG